MTGLFSIFVALFIALLSVPLVGNAQNGSDRLPNTGVFPWKEEDVSAHIMDGAHRFVDGRIAAAIQTREERVVAGVNKEAFDTLRQRLHQMIGLVDKRVPTAAFEKFGSGRQPGLVAETKEFRIWQVRWPVLPTYWAEGLLVEPSVPSGAAWIAVPDADETPEQVLGIGVAAPAHHQHVIKLALAGHTVLVPTLVNRQEHVVSIAGVVKPVGQSHREWLHRQSFHMGRHVLGYEVQEVCSAIDILMKSKVATDVSCSGYGEGGMVALLAMAADERIHGGVVAGYFGQEVSSWEQPLFRNIQCYERDMGDAGLIRLLKGRPLLIHAVDGPGYSDAKGKLVATVKQQAIDRLLQSLDEETRVGCKVTTAPVLSAAELAGFAEGVQEVVGQALQDQRVNFASAERHQRVLGGIEAHVQQLIRDADELRDEKYAYKSEPSLRRGNWSTKRSHATLDPARFVEASKGYREAFSREAMGEFDARLLALNPRSRKIIENEKWTAWDVALDVYPELTAWGALILPNNIKEGEKRPVIVVQHGRNGLPRDWIDFEKTAYTHAGVELAERGFIVFAPHNIYRGEDRYRWLNRKANTVGATLFSFIIPSHRQILHWLKTLPEVDAGRIAFYGLSYGGESAMRIPAVLEDYAAVICSGDFNQWTRKVAATDYPNGFMTSIEWEMPYWNLGQSFDYAEMSYLIFPRPFMVERGHHDLVATDPWVAFEYAKVRYLYAQFGLDDRTEIEFFQGGHSINDQNTFRFLHRHLRWPEPGR